MKTTRDFNLEKALKDAELETKMGLKVINFQLREGYSGGEYPYKGFLQQSENCGGGFWITFTKDGKQYSHTVSEFDLVMSENLPEEGDEIFVKQFDGDAWEKRIFLYFDKHDNPVCVHKNDKREYKIDGVFRALSWPTWKFVEKDEEKSVSITIVVFR